MRGLQTPLNAGPILVESKIWDKKIIIIIRVVCHYCVAKLCKVILFIDNFISFQ